MLRLFKLSVVAATCLLCLCSCLSNVIGSTVLPPIPTLPPLYNNLYASTFSGESVFAVGGGGVILKSTNGGDSWIKESNIYTDDLHGVGVIGESIFAVGSNGIILKSINGGDSWVKQANIQTSQLNSIAGNSSYIVVVGRESTLLLSRNGGDNWSRESNTHTDSTYFTSVVLGSSDEFIAVGGQDDSRIIGGLIMTLNKNANKWTSSLLSDAAKPYVLYFSDATTDNLRNTYAVAHSTSAKNLLYYKNTAGKFASIVTDDLFESNNKILNAIAKHDANIVAVGTVGTILLSKDSGMTWAQQYKPNVFRFFNAVSYSTDGSKAIAIGDNGVIFVSTNSGESWEIKTNPAPKI